MTAHSSLQRSIAIGLPALVLVASCVPQEPPRADASRVVLKPDARTLLKQLALTIPKTTDAALPPVLPATETPLSGPVAAPPFVAEARSPQDFGRAEECLTAAIYYEARSQTEDGQRAVAQVVLNRVRDLAFPASVCGVVYQGSTRRTGCQFSFTCDGSMDRRRDPWSWARARDVAAAALGGAVYAPVGSATHYHATSVLPWWASSLSRIGQVGAHIFYRWQNGMERALAFRQAYAGVEPGTVGGDGPALANADVAVHYSDETVAGVMIHRGNGAVTRSSAAEATVATPKMVRVSSVAGVRVHYGRHAPVPSDPTDSASAGEDSGTI